MLQNTRVVAFEQLIFWTINFREFEKELYFMINALEKQYVLREISENLRLQVKIWGKDLEAYLEPFQTSMMELFCENS